MAKRVHKSKTREEEEEATFRAPKLPRTTEEKEKAKRLIVVLEAASLETVKVGRGFQLLNSTDHANILRKNERDSINLRPDITHQCLLMLLDSPLNKAGLLQVYIRTAKNVLIEVHPQTRIPRIYSRFSALMVQLLRDLSISTRGADGSRAGGMKLLKVIKNPVTNYLPINCRKIATSYNCEKLVRLPTYLPTVAADKPVCLIVGAVAHGAIEVSAATRAAGPLAAEAPHRSPARPRALHALLAGQPAPDACRRRAVRSPPTWFADPLRSRRSCHVCRRPGRTRPLPSASTPCLRPGCALKSLTPASRCGACTESTRAFNTEFSAGSTGSDRSPLCAS